jgi:hypothetical protein
VGDEQQQQQKKKDERCALHPRPAGGQAGMKSDGVGRFKPLITP